MAKYTVYNRHILERSCQSHKSINVEATTGSALQVLKHFKE